jgi:ribosomal protein L29
MGFLSAESEKIIKQIQRPKNWQPTNRGKVVGLASDASPIRAEIIGDGNKSLLAWGFPHPNEPVGAKALELFADWLKDNPKAFADWKFIFVYNADPVQSSMQTWFKKPKTIENFLEGNWRSYQIGYEIDYGFPIDFQHRYQPENAQGRNMNIWKPLDPFELEFIEPTRGPLAESKTLLALIENYKPEIIATMHNMHASGDYSFLLHREKEHIMQGLAKLPETVGCVRHLGEPADPGFLWDPWPDLFQEYDLAYDTIKYMKRDDWQPGNRYSGNAGIGLVIESQLPETQILTPEIGLFSNDKMADTNQAELPEFNVRIFSQNDWLNRAIEIENEWHVFDRKPYLKLKQIDCIEAMPAPRKALELIVYYNRNQVLDFIEETYEKVSFENDLKWHPYMIDRKLYENSTRKEFVISDIWSENNLTVAEYENYRTTQPIETAMYMSPFLNMLHGQSSSDSINQTIENLKSYQLELIAYINPQSRKQTDSLKLVRSQIARILLLLENY